MKTKLHVLALSLLTASALVAADTKTTKTTTEKADGSTVTETKTTTSMGTLSEYTPGTTFVVKETSGPVTYRYGKAVTYVTKSGKAISDDEVKTRIKVGLPVSVHYTTEGDSRVVSRVVIDD